MKLQYNNDGGLNPLNAPKLSLCLLDYQHYLLFNPVNNCLIWRLFNDLVVNTY